MQTHYHLQRPSLFRIVARQSLLRDGGQRAVKVAVTVVRVMQVTVDEIIDVISMRDGHVATPFAMLMRRVMSSAPMCRRAVRRVGRGDIDPMLIDRIAVLMVKVAIVQIVHVSVVEHGRVAATLTMHMRMIGML